MSYSRIATQQALTLDEVRSLAPAYGTILQSIAGRALVLTELVTGAPAVDGEPAYTPPNPDGEIGVNFSGPPWGAAFKHPVHVAGHGGQNLCALAGAQPLCTLSYSTAAPSLASWRRTFTFDNRRFDASYPESPYSKLALRLRCHRSASSTTFTVRVTTNAGYEFTEDVTTNASSSSETAAELTQLIPMRPGKNSVTVGFELATGETNIVTINQIVFLQNVKTGH